MRPALALTLCWRVGPAVNRRMDEWVKMENLDLTTVDISDSEGSDGRGCARPAAPASALDRRRAL